MWDKVKISRRPHNSTSTVHVSLARARTGRTSELDEMNWTCARSFDCDAGATNSVRVKLTFVLF